MKKNHPQAILKIQNYMEKQGAFINQCCRVKDKFLADEDVIIHNCTLCYLILNERYLNNKCLSLYEYVLKDQNFPWIDHYGECMTVQDCWRTRDNLEL